MIKDHYFDYICSLVGIDEDYYKLAKYLMEKPFFYILPMDGNREADGIELRYNFGHDLKIDQSLIASELDVDQCSVLEVLAALSLRINNIITSEQNAQFIFWSMIENLGLDSQTNYYFSERYCDDKVDTFLNREYQPNGDGGLVTLSDPPTDLRNVEIWDQLLWWINESEL